MKPTFISLYHRALLGLAVLLVGVVAVGEAAAQKADDSGKLPIRLHVSAVVYDKAGQIETADQLLVQLEPEDPISVGPTGAKLLVPPNEKTILKLIGPGFHCSASFDLTALKKGSVTLIAKRQSSGDPLCSIQKEEDAKAR